MLMCSAFLDGRVEGVRGCVQVCQLIRNPRVALVFPTGWCKPCCAASRRAKQACRHASWFDGMSTIDRAILLSFCYGKQKKRKKRKEGGEEKKKPHLSAKGTNTDPPLRIVARSFSAVRHSRLYFSGFLSFFSMFFTEHPKGRASLSRPAVLPSCHRAALPPYEEVASSSLGRRPLCDARPHAYCSYRVRLRWAKGPVPDVQLECSRSL